MRVAADVDVGVLPGDGDHLPFPRVAEVNADHLQVGKVDSDAINRGGEADGGRGDGGEVALVVAGAAAPL